MYLLSDGTLTVYTTIQPSVQILNRMIICYQYFLGWWYEWSPAPPVNLPLPAFQPYGRGVDNDFSHSQPSNLPPAFRTDGADFESALVQTCLDGRGFNAHGEYENTLLLHLAMLILWDSKQPLNVVNRQFKRYIPHIGNNIKFELRILSCLFSIVKQLGERVLPRTLHHPECRSGPSFKMLNLTSST